MKSCCERQGSHGRCRAAIDSIALPTRLVDVGTFQHPLIKLVETNQREAYHGAYPYLILSYCWGQGNTSAKTTNYNLMKRLQEISVDELPKTIQDAILVTRMMGFQYIWIDAICIIQATDGEAGDFTSEAPKMGDYYANADCCISASLASDSSEGFLTQRPLARFPIIQDIILKFSDSPSTPSNSLFLWAHQRHYNLKKTLTDTPLMKRGWYQQELMLSRRILHWTFHGLYLQCQSSICLEGSLEVWSNCLSPDVSLDPEFSSRNVFDPREVLALPYDRILAFDGWCRLVENFSKRELTFESDRLYAIHGIACVLVQRFGAEYFYGLFRRHLAQGLAWARDSNFVVSATLDKPFKPSRRTEYPTWCWASDCPVKFDPIDENHIFVRDDHPRRPRLFPTHPLNMTLGAGLDSRLYIQAPLIHVRLRRAMVGAYIRHNRNDRRIEGSCSWILDTQLEGINASIAPGTPLFYPGSCLREQGVDVQWLLLGSHARDGGSYLGLLVYEVEGQGMRVYRRYARLKIQCENRTSVREFFDELELEEIILE